MDKAVRQKKISLPHLALALVVGWMLATAPIREVRAAIPALAAVGMFLRTPLGKSLATSLAIHAAVLAVEFHNSAAAAPPSNDAEKRLEVKLNPADPMSTPPGWTAPSGGSVEPSPPATATPTSGKTWGGHSSWAAWCTAHWSQGCWVSGGNNAFSGVLGHAFNPSPTAYNVGDTFQGYAAPGSGCDGCSATVAVTETLTCPTGYVVNASSCVLSNASLVQKPPDGKAEIKRVGNVLYTDARDTADGLPPGVTVTPDKVTFVDSQGGKWETTINADGTSTTKESKPRGDGSNKTDVTTSAFSAPDPSSGAVELVGQSVQSFSGTGALQSTTPDATGSGDGAKEATLQALKSSTETENAEVEADRVAAETVAGSTGTAINQVPETAWTIAGVTLPNQEAYTVADVSGVGDLLPSNAGECVNLETTLPYLGAMVINPCPVVQKVQPLVDWMVRALSVIAAYFIWFGRKES